jgi:hypothetical protein
MGVVLQLFQAIDQGAGVNKKTSDVEAGSDLHF